MSTSTRLPASIQEAIGKETSGEKVKWAGQPDPASVFRNSLGIWVVGIPWSALIFPIFAVLILAIFFGAPPERAIATWEVFLAIGVLIFASVFVLVGIGMLVAPFWAAWKARRAVHVITDKRLITISVGRNTEVKSVLPEQILEFERRKHRNGRGSLTIVKGYSRNSDGFTSKETEQIIGIRDPDAVEKHLRELKAGGPA